MPSAVGQSAPVQLGDSASNAGSARPNGKVTVRASMTDAVNKVMQIGTDKNLYFSRPKGTKDAAQLEVVNEKDVGGRCVPSVKAQELKTEGKPFKSMKVKAATAFLLRF